MIPTGCYRSEKMNQEKRKQDSKLRSWVFVAGSYFSLKHIYLIYHPNYLTFPSHQLNQLSGPGSAKCQPICKMSTWLSPLNYIEMENRRDCWNIILGQNNKMSPARPIIANYFPFSLLILDENQFFDQIKNRI